MKPTVQNFLVLEDSSKVKFGGGQKVTLSVMEKMSSCLRIFLVDYSDASIFVNRAKKYCQKFLLLNGVGKIVRADKNSFSLGVHEILTMPWYLIVNYFLMKKFLRDSNLNSKNTILYAPTKKGLLIAWLLSLTDQFEYIYHAHNIDDTKSPFFLLIKIAMKNAVAIICVSQQVSLNLALPECVVLPNPIAMLAGQSPKSLGQKVVVASFSNLIPVKGIRYFMESFQFLKNKERVEYWIFGEGSEISELKPLENTNVILKGFADQNQELLAHEVSIVIVPSISAEASSMVALEAFSHGVPVVTTEIGGQAEMVKNNQVGFHVPPKDARAIAEKIDFLIENPQVYVGMSSASLDCAAQFDLKDYGDKFYDLVKEFL